jgi:ElaB/YqjD/DUF883 family membrane-anchored ribosome-binding protein
METQTKTPTSSHFETPNALAHDARVLADDARGLLEATAHIADEKVAAARKRLGEALEASRATYHRLQEKVARGAQMADQTVRTHPYESIALAFGLGALIGFLASRRN